MKVKDKKNAVKLIKKRGGIIISVVDASKGFFFELKNKEDLEMVIELTPQDIFSQRVFLIDYNRKKSPALTPKMMKPISEFFTEIGCPITN